MTGYGRSALQMENLSLFLEIASVNKRHLEIFISAPKEWQKFEYDATKYVKSILERGRVRISISTVKNTELDRNMRLMNHRFKKTLIGWKIF